MKKRYDLVINYPFLVSSFIFLRIFSGEATSAPPLGPILGQNQLNINDFCKEFNNKSSRFFENFLLNVLVIKNIEKKGDFIIVIKQPTIDFFFDQFLYFDNSCFFLLINEAFDLVKIKSKEFGYNYKRMAFFFFSFLKSTVCKKIKLSLNF